MPNSKYIVILDSGMGGLTVARKFKDSYQNIPIIYFGDTKYFPYGEKSSKFLSKRIIELLRYFSKSSNYLGLIVACHSASTAVFDLDSKSLNIDFSKITNIVTPTFEIIKNGNYKNVGLIATQRTIESGIYLNLIKKHNISINLYPIAAPELASIIENDINSSKSYISIIDKYLKDYKNKLDCLVLGCTHYPIIKDEIANYFANNIEIIDPSDIVINFLSKKRSDFEKINHLTFEPSKDIFFTSNEVSPTFNKIAEDIFKEKICFQTIAGVETIL